MILSKDKHELARAFVLLISLAMAAATIPNAGTLDPYPGEFHVEVGEDELLHFAGRWSPKSIWKQEEGTLPFVVESDVPVILNRINFLPEKNYESGVPAIDPRWGHRAISVFVKSDCHHIGIDPIHSTELVMLNGTETPKISISADLSGVSSPCNVLPSSDFLQDIDCIIYRWPRLFRRDESCNSTDEATATDKATDRFKTKTTTVCGPPRVPSASSAFSSRITTSFVFGVISTITLLVLGTVGTVETVFGTNRGGRLTMIGVTAAAIAVTIFIAVLPPPVRSLSTSSSSSLIDGSSQSFDDSQPQCTINVEIVYWGCYDEVYVDAPGVILRNNNESDYLRMVTGENDGVCMCHQTIRFEDVMWDAAEDMALQHRIPHVGVEWETWKDRVDGIEAVEANGNALYHVMGGRGVSSRGCSELPSGRPYRDHTGSVVFASIFDANEEEDGEKNQKGKGMVEKSWSEPSLSFLSDRDSMIVVEEDRRHRLGNDHRRRRAHERLGKEWATRALGEHASIASFAAFTLALMSHGAPPDLIRDSLAAAQDEWRHAKASFEIASMLLSPSMSRTVEPTALPPSDVRFGRNLTALALGTAREGCIEETFSAIEMAVEYDEFLGSRDDGNEKDGGTTEMLIMETTKTIALEEGNHSALAWRTMEWICSSGNSDSEDACQTVQQQFMNPLALEKAGNVRFPSSPQARRLWECIWTSLLPVIAVAGNDDKVDIEKQKIDVNASCSLAGMTGVREHDNGVQLSELLAAKIISRVKPNVTFGARSFV